MRHSLHRTRRQECSPWTPTFFLLLLLGDCRGFVGTCGHGGSMVRAPSRRDRPPQVYTSRTRPSTATMRSSCHNMYSNAGFDDMERVGDNLRKQYDWEEIGAADVLVPKHVEFPLGIVHFAGGAGLGMFPRSTYGTLLEALVDAGFLVIATRVRLNEFNHQALACDMARDFRIAYREVEALYGRAQTRRIPVFGVGHSLGAKVQVLLNCYPEVVEVAKRRKANVVMSFNNFAAKESVPFLEELRSLGLSMGNLESLGDNLSGLAKAVAGVPLMGGIATQGLSIAEEWAPKAVAAVGSALSDVPQEFIPSPEDTWDLVEDQYTVRNNFVLQFKRDTIDQSPRLAETLFNRFGREGELKFSRLDGSHLTPNTPDLRDTQRVRDWARGSGLETTDRSVMDEDVQLSAAGATRELVDTIASLISYLRSQSLWVRLEGRWDSDEM